MYNVLEGGMQPRNHITPMRLVGMQRTASLAPSSIRLPIIVLGVQGGLLQYKHSRCAP